MLPSWLLSDASAQDHQVIAMIVRTYFAWKILDWADRWEVILTTEANMYLNPWQYEYKIAERFFF